MWKKNLGWVKVFFPKKTLCDCWFVLAIRLEILDDIDCDDGRSKFLKRRQCAMKISSCLFRNGAPEWPFAAHSGTEMTKNILGVQFVSKIACAVLHANAIPAYEEAPYAIRLQKRGFTQFFQPYRILSLCKCPLGPFYCNGWWCIARKKTRGFKPTCIRHVNCA